MPPLQSILLISQNPQEYLLKHLKLDLNHKTADLYLVETEKSIGIEAVRDTFAYTLSPPLTGPHKYLVFLNAHTLTLEAQNALLKLLEEPPAYLSVILAAATASPFIDTVVSRCQIIYNAPPELKPSASPELPQIIKLRPPARLAFIPTSAKSKDGAIAWIATLLAEARGDYSAAPGANSLHNLIQLENCSEALERNANPSTCVADALIRLR